jgi:hypothetical protein
MYMHYNHFHGATAHLQLNTYLLYYIVLYYVGIVRSRTKAMEFSFFLVYII